RGRVGPGDRDPRGLGRLAAARVPQLRGRYVGTGIRRRAAAQGRPRMEAPVTDLVLGGGGALSVDVASLGHELRRLWQENAREGSPITRACTRNLVALCASEEE